ncbi:MAG: helix-turn-helix domain-containing protein [Brasilonema octagenarum HA4186-MV1]|uniref:Response regulator n=1 Tax=Brasilonema sennae CENA114 TaxID=415709 RepID=A0A856MEI5_9CYAN|nr:AraC family transcriptional regulator [Brasilonema sennae]MBW4624635.1 helix-turn-helix domain-containing protein [Brasilonema octagenarum HA4186-MV1]QDL08539.1 response regulator [Brasilonema sennae CENA114]QDL14894.1 response regulator [Brasilonema octagenarum UFV-E1]
MFLKDLEAKVFEASDSENSFISAKQTGKSFPNNSVLCEIEMPRLDSTGFIKVLYQGSVRAVIPFNLVSSNTRRLEQHQDMNLKTDEDLNKSSALEEFLRKICELGELSIYTASLEEQSLLNKHWRVTLSEEESKPSPPKTTNSTDDNSIFPTDSLLSQIFDFIEKNYDSAITLCNVAQAVGYSAGYLTDLVRRLTGKTVNHWIIERRMSAARALLLETKQSVNKIALTVGYQHEGHFFRQFRQYHGTTPQAWRKIQHSEE